MPFSVHEKISELRREIQMRKRVYANRVQSNKMTLDAASRQLGIMEEILRDYEVQERAGSGEQAKLL